MSLVDVYKQKYDEEVKKTEKLEREKRSLLLALRDLCYCDTINNLQACRACKFRNGQ